MHRSQAELINFIYSDHVPKGQIIEASFVPSSSKDYYEAPQERREDSVQKISNMLYYTAKYLQKSLKEAKSTLPWPPCADDLIEENIPIPVELCNFSVYIFSTETLREELQTARIKASETIHRKVLSIGQDTSIYLIVNSQCTGA